VTLIVRTAGTRNRVLGTSASRWPGGAIVIMPGTFATPTSMLTQQTVTETTTEVHNWTISS
jgi:hypothetical protein